MKLKTIAACVVAYLAGAYVGNVAMQVWYNYRNGSYQ